MLANGRPEDIDRMSMFPGLEKLLPPEMKVPAYKLFAKKTPPRIIATHLPWQFLPKEATEDKKGRVSKRRCYEKCFILYFKLWSSQTVS